jgi:heavy metal translocating P-type ATPase
MTWWQSLRSALLDAIDDLDQILDVAGERFHKTVTLRIGEVAGEIDEAFDGVGAGAGTELALTVRRSLTDLDERYQRFIVRRIDPLFGRTRTAQLEEMGGVEISPVEQYLNRGMAFAAGAFIAIVVGGALVPSSLFVTVPLSFTIMLPIYRRAIETVREQRRVTYNVVTAVGVTGIWLLGFYAPALAAMCMYYVSEKLLVITEDRSHKGLVAVFSKQPRTVWRSRDGVEQEVPFEEILPNDIVVVDAGTFMPVDGTVVDGLASIDQQMLTGEAQPVEKATGDVVYASTMVLAGKLHVRVDKAGEETVAAKIGDVLNRTASYQLSLQSRGVELSNKFALPVLAGGAAATVMLGPESGLSVVNSSFGTAVRLGGPITMLNLLNIASRNSILLKDGRSLELLSDIDTVLFDKTGTLTLAQPHVAAVHRTGAFDEETLLTFAAAAEHRQTHPIALAIAAEAAARGLPLPDVSNARYEVGYGIKVELEGRTIQVGSDRFMHLLEIGIPDDILAQRAASHARGNSFIMVAVDGELAGGIDLQPTIRPEAESVIQALHKRGLKLMIVSGDQEEPTRRLAETLGLDRYFANVLPEAKASLVDQLQAEGRSVCFVGDGINDAIALKRAKVSVSLRGATMVAMDVAQVLLMQESLRQLPFLFQLGDDMNRTLKLGLIVGIVPGAINVAGVFLLGTGFYTAIILSISSLIATMGIAMYPAYKYRLQRTETRDPASQAASVPLLLPAPQVA